MKEEGLGLMVKSLFKSLLETRRRVRVDGFVFIEVFAWLREIGMMVA